MPASEKVNMEMVYQLTTLGIAVGHEPETPFSYALFACNPVGHLDHMTEKIQIPIRNV